MVFSFGIRLASYAVFSTQILYLQLGKTGVGETGAGKTGIHMFWMLYFMVVLVVWDMVWL